MNKATEGGRMLTAAQIEAAEREDHGLLKVAYQQLKDRLLSCEAALTAAQAPVVAEPVAWMAWRKTLALKVDEYIQLQSDDDDDEAITESYNALKAHILETPFAAPDPKTEP